MKLIILFFVTIISVFIMDMIWLGFIAKNIYAENIGMLLRKSGEVMAPIWWAAVVVYVCIRKHLDIIHSVSNHDIYATSL